MDETEAIVIDATHRLDAIEGMIEDNYGGQWMAIMAFPMNDSAQFASANGL